MSPDTILITGASGFIGGAVLAHLRDAGRPVRGTARRPAPGLELAPPLDPTADWTPLLAGVDAVVHCAARVHVLRERSPDPLADFRRVNRDGTVLLAQQAAAAGVRRFVFISSIAVNGRTTPPGRSFTAADPPAPEDPYGVSKYEAETALFGIAAATGMEVVILRPPLVHGPGARGNFSTLLRAVKAGVPLPFGAVCDNRRSLVGLSNLVDLIGICIDHPTAGHQVFLAADAESPSTAALLAEVARALGVRSRLIAVPPTWLEAMCRLAGKPVLAQQLLGNLRLDIDKNREVLGWTPPVPLADEMRRTASALATRRCSVPRAEE